MQHARWRHPGKNIKGSKYYVRALVRRR
jgi:hypothetical protein